MEMKGEKVKWKNCYVKHKNTESEALDNN